MENLRPGRKMSLLSNLTPVVLLLIVHCGSWSLAIRLGPHKNCLSCKDGHFPGTGRASRDPAGAPSTTVLASGEPCGVYTLSCARGLRCMPPPRDHSPLQALLQGRGFCAKHGRMSPTERPRPTGISVMILLRMHVLMGVFMSVPCVQKSSLKQDFNDCIFDIFTGPHPSSHSGDLEKQAPCRRLLNSVLRGLELTIFQSDRDIYIPNCDVRGFYRKKQCLSSKGMQRGHCWCVDELGTALASRAGEDGILPCDGE
ncbi:hypothetical protein DNTS_015580 [Danionella cerebrum]|uniref:Thyroglobulin type-1 domain-containing protein n=1 Tax=Danionella cerebrum TaxID=2873325 RepID=A0A553R1S6_9TELE|nr:hypothetical protein DNTS_015580 [Danionella translucida]